MADAAPSETPLPPQSPREGRGTAAGQAHRQLRWVMYLAFAVLALAVLAQGHHLLRLQAVSEADTEAVDRAANQRALPQQIGRLAALIVAEPAERGRSARSLRLVLGQSRDEALALEGLLAGQRGQAAGSGAAPGAVLEAWRVTRERLWSRAGALLRQLDAGGGTDLLPVALTVQAEVEPALAAAQGLSAALRGAAERRTADQQRALWLGTGAVLALLLLLGLTAVEASARAVHRTTARLQERAAELQRLALVAQRTAALVLITDRDDRLTWVNDAFTRVTGWPLADAAGQRPGELLDSPHADAKVLARLQGAIRQGRGARHEWLHRSRGGRDLWLDVDLCPLRDDDGQPSGFVRVCTDVTMRVQQQDKLQALWKAMPVGVVVQGAGGEIVEANRAAERLLGLSMVQLRRRSSTDPRWRVVREDGSDSPVEEHPPMRTLTSGRALRGQLMGIRTPKGEPRWLLVNTEPLRDAAGQITGVVSCFDDVTESRRLQEHLSGSTPVDALTPAPDRAVVLERLERAIDHACRYPGYGFAVLRIDFDRFSQVEETLGHAASGELLRQVAERLQLALRPGDVAAHLDGDTRLAAHSGGDGFVVVLEGVHDAQAVGVIAERLLEELAEPYLLGSSPVQAGASLGAVLYTGGDTTADRMLRDADTAMFEARRAGRGRWVMFDDSMHERVARALAVEADLRRALENHELFVVYQPVMDLAERVPVGVEALVRWRHPTRGLVPPEEFIGIAEEAGLIDAVGSQVLRAACVQFMRWRRELGALAPRDLTMNLSPAELKRGDLVRDVQALLQETGMHPAQLQLEVTETLATEDERVQRTLRDLRSLGVKLALDDFGTGYSSLACLHRMPVDTVKVDRTFVRGAETVETHRVLVESTIRVARALGMTTVAEGIETEGQAALMLQLDCDRGQGFLFSRPLEAADFEVWLRRETATVALG